MGAPPDWAIELGAMGQRELVDIMDRRSERKEKCNGTFSVLEPRGTRNDCMATPFHSLGLPNNKRKIDHA
jgi:hypothetical protein